MARHPAFAAASALAMTIALVAAPAKADLPGATQPGAQPVPPGSLLILREVPPRNAMLPGVGAAVTAPVTPPASVFSSTNGVFAILGDNDAASISGQIHPGQSGGFAGSAVDILLDSGSLLRVGNTERATGGGIGGAVSDAVQTGVDALHIALDALGGGQ